MSLNSMAEIKEFIQNIDCGKPIFKISYEYRSLNLKLNSWKAKEELIQSNDWLLSGIGSNIDRRYDDTTRTLKIDLDRVTQPLNEYIHNSVIDLAGETSPSDQPKRTNAYKEICEISYQNKREEAFQNDILPILNYYYKAKTESKDKSDMVVHKNNVQALLTILRKKYARPKNGIR